MKLGDILLDNPDIEVESLITDPELSLRSTVHDVFESSDLHTSIRSIIERELLGDTTL